MTDPITLKDGGDYAKIPEGATFAAPDGTVRKKPYSVKDDESYKAVPEGSHFVDPQGKLRIKPSYDALSSQAQAVFDMAVNPKEQRNALIHFYGKDAIKETPEDGLYVEQPGGRRLKPGKGTLPQKAGAFVQRMAAPMGAAGLGEVAGGLFGLRGGKTGAALGSVVGAGVGSLVGQAYNDAMLAVMGVYDRTPLEELTQLGEASGAGVEGSMGGQAVGKVVGKIVNGAKGIPDVVKQVQPLAAKIGRTVFGAKGEDFDTAAELAKKGLSVPAQTWAKTAPYAKFIQNWAKQHGYDPVKESAETYYNAVSRKIMSELGIQPEEASTRTTAAASSEEAGKTVLAKARSEMANADAQLNQVHEEALRRAGVASPEEKATSVRDLQVSIENNEKVAQKVIDSGWQDIDETRKAMWAASKVGGNPGDLSRTLAEKLQNLSKAVKSRARIMYTAADAATGGRLPNVTPLRGEAEAFIKALPEGFAKKYPDDIAKIAKLGAEKEGEKASPVTFGQLHQIRSFLRHGIDWMDLSPDFRQGALRKFAFMVNQTLHDGEAAPELKQAASILDRADAYYARNMGAFHDAKIQGLVDMTESGLPPNPSVIAKMVMEQEGGWTERMTKLRRMVGPQTWKAVQAADLQNMLNASKTLAPGQINATKFADQILKRYQSGVLDNGYDKATAAKLLKQAQRIAIKGGNLDFKLLPGDDVSQAMARINAAQSHIDQIVSKDPYSALASEVRKLEAEHAARVTEQKIARSVEPLNFLNEPSALAMASADRILGSPDLLKAAAVRFGPESSEFTMLRQVAAQRILQRTLSKTMNLGGDFAQYTADTQKLLFPNGLDQSVIKLGREMKALFPKGESDFGSSLAGAQTIIHPREFASKYVGKKLIGPEFLHRIYVSSALEKASAFFSSPKLILWLASRSKPLTAEEEGAITNEAMKWVKYGGTAGAAVGGAMSQDRKTPQTAITPPRRNWQDDYNQRYGGK